MCDCLVLLTHHFFFLFTIECHLLFGLTLFCWCLLQTKFYVLIIFIYQLDIQLEWWVAGKKAVHTQHHECLLHQTHCLTNDHIDDHSTQHLLFEINFSFVMILRLWSRPVRDFETRLTAIERLETNSTLVVVVFFFFA